MLCFTAGAVVESLSPIVTNFAITLFSILYLFIHRRLRNAKSRINTAIFLLLKIKYLLKVYGKIELRKTINQSTKRRYTYMITHKQLTLAEVFEDCPKENSTTTNTSSFHFLMKPLTLMKLFLFLLLLIFTLQPEDLVSTSFIQCLKLF